MYHHHHHHHQYNIILALIWHWFEILLVTIAMIIVTISLPKHKNLNAYFDTLKFSQRCITALPYLRLFLYAVAQTAGTPLRLTLKVRCVVSMVIFDWQRFIIITKVLSPVSAFASGRQTNANLLLSRVLILFLIIFCCCFHVDRVVVCLYWI